jgi:UDP-glucuronate decarboxylase
VAESLCYAYQQHHKIDVRVARIFNAYGPGMLPSYGRAISNFIAAAMSGQPLVITGDGSAIRCFQYVIDCIFGLTKLMASEDNQPMNIGSDIPCRIGQLANIVLHIVRKNGFPLPDNPIIYHPAPADDPVLRQPGITLAKKVLSWSPAVRLEDGIQKTIDWFRTRQDPTLSGPVPFHDAGIHARHGTG